MLVATSSVSTFTMSNEDETQLLIVVCNGANIATYCEAVQYEDVTLVDHRLSYTVTSPTS
jgi:hypothetical protein